MKIRDYIQEQILAKRLKQKECLVVYDPASRLREICQGMADNQCAVIDASESTIEKREEAMAAFRGLAKGEGALRHLLIYLPVAKPESDVELQEDPFSFFAKTGEVFPKEDGDRYESLAKRAKPEHAGEIARLFEQGEPTLDTIDALDQSGGWPTLTTTLNAQSATEILRHFLVPDEPVQRKLKKSDTWASEMKDFLRRTLGLKLRTRSKSWRPVAEELWRFVLFSEFAFDLPVDLPESLTEIPHAADTHRDLIEGICDELRKKTDCQNAYMDQAQRVAKELDLETKVAHVDDLGHRDTFSFEERSFLKRFITAVRTNDLDRAREIYREHHQTIWLQDEERLSQWNIASACLDLVSVAQDLSGQIKGHVTTMSGLIQFYVGHFRELDRHHRELEQAVADVFHDLAELDELVEVARRGYRDTAATAHGSFIGHFEASGWPQTELLANGKLFDEKVAPLLEQRKRVAFFMIDALRYELAVELEKQLSEESAVEMEPVCAQLPTITKVGMASILPKASTELNLKDKNGKLAVHLGERLVEIPDHRIAHMKSIYGDRCQDVVLHDLVTKQKTLKFPDTTDLLVVRSWEIDKILESSPQELVRIIPNLVRRIIAGVHAVKGKGFDYAVIATDHGFVLLNDYVAGDAMTPPQGDWKLQKERCLLGKGKSDGKTLVVSKEEAGIRGDFRDYATPRTLGVYRKGTVYYHSGASLQECVLPVMTIALSRSPLKDVAAVSKIILTYRKGATDKITMMVPVLELSLTGDDFFSSEMLEVSVEAQDSKGKVVGEVAAGKDVNPATGCVRLHAGASVPIRLRMDEDFRGTFHVKVLDPSTLAKHASLKLRTDYTE